MRRLIFALWLALAIGPLPAIAQFDAPALDGNQPVALVADRVSYDSTTGVLVAEGAVEVFYGDRTLTARKITYDSRADRIGAEGQIVLRDESGATVFADVAELDGRLRDGIVTGAKSVIAAEVKLAAVEGRRVDNRYNVLSKAVYSPCKVCAEDPTPLWRIRARRVIHDQEARIVHYENAWFDLFGVPVAWVPYFRHPDPTVTRTSGFLVPSFKQSTSYGYGLQVPYNWVIDDSSDLLVTPFVTSEEGLILSMEYRRAFDSGTISVGGSFGHTDFDGSPSLEGNLLTTGRFDIGSGFFAGWDVNLVSDDAYLRFFDFSNADRLTSEAYVERWTERGYITIAALRFQSLRDGEPAGQIPLVMPDVDLRQTYDDPWAGGEFGLFASSQMLLRTNGAETARITLGADWERQWITPQGIAFKAFGEVRGDVFFRRGDPALPDVDTFRLAPLMGVEARYPLVWEQENGTAHVIEPMAQAILAPYGGNGLDVPNEDSLVNELDETNLFDRSHFTGLDGFEEGPRFNVGIRYERIAADGVTIDAALGRVFRFRDADEFSASSGLVNAQSDWVGSWGLGWDPYVTVRQRLRVDDAFTITRNEILADLKIDRVTLTGSYIFLEADPLIGALVDREEVTADLTLALTQDWSVGAFVQRDLELGEFVEVGGTIGFENECCAIELFLKRRFTDQIDAPAATSIGVQVRLLTLGTADRAER